MNGQLVRTQLRRLFPGSFLLTKRCRCTVHVYGDGAQAPINVDACGRCRRYARWKAQRVGRA
ncbi:MAG: hypothetical protein AB1411_02405 [Nitrospirota bacterium]